MQTRFIVGGALVFGAILVMSIATYFANQEAYYTVDELIGGSSAYVPSDRGQAAEPGGSDRGDPEAYGDAELPGGGGAGSSGAITPAGRRMQVRGVVDAASVRRIHDGLEMRFDLTGKSGAVPVVYHGVVPDAFDLAESVTVGGRFAADGTFEADQLFVQCPSKYEAVPPGATPPAGVAPPDA